MEEGKPIVSVCLITYNSIDYVVESLESIKAQSYLDIELIISDDCSKDATVSVCKKWIQQNNSRFKRVELLVSETNMGVSSNFQRAINAAKGKWIKGLGGDDVLSPNCIKTYVDFIFENPEVQIVFSKPIFFTDKCKVLSVERDEPLRLFFQSKEISSKQQHKILRYFNFVEAPTTFISKAVIEKAGGFDLRIKMIEDWPMWINLTSLGFKIHFMNESLVWYRVSASSITGASSEEIFSKMYTYEREIFDLYQKSNFSYVSRLLFSYSFFLKSCFVKLKINRRTYLPLFRFCNFPFSVYLRLMSFFLQFGR